MNPFNDKYEQITRLMAKKIAGKISSDEDIILNEWINESEKNLQVYRKIESEENWNKRTEILSHFNTRKGWEHIRRTLQFEEERKANARQIRLKVIQLVAAVLFPIGLFFFMYNYLNDKEERELVVAQKVQYGESRALLTLEDGTVFEINNQDTTREWLKLQVGIAIDSLGANYNVKKSNALSNEEYHTLETPRNCEYQLTLADGTQVWMNASTKLRYPKQFNGQTRDVFVTGEAYFEVVENKAKPFFVHFKGNRVEVLGTKFNIKAHSNEKVDFVTLAEGSIALKHDKQQVVLKPNHQAVINNTIDDIEIEEVDASMFIAWTEGKFMYKDEKLEEIINDMARWYNLNVFYQNQGMKEKRFSINTNRYGSIEEMIQVLEATNKVKFEVNENNVIVKSIN